MNVKIHESWKRHLEHEFGKEYFLKLVEFVKGEYVSKTVYPQPKNIFRAFELCPFEHVKVVILGQDPYHGKGQANGLAFSVGDGVAVPPSLQNMYKEMVKDLVLPPDVVARANFQSGSLDHWARQGVLLLNATLTVAAGQAGSHQKKGWEEFTDSVIRAISDQKEHVVFLLWGRYAQQKGQIIDRSKHLVLEAAHPSPFSAFSGFFGCRHFSRANAYLKSHGQAEIQWYNASNE
ncbi:MAG: uracil-DNA glycosylase [Patescibacteria group bacterium]